MTLGSVKNQLHREVCMYRSQEFQDPLAVYCSRDVKADDFSFSISIHGFKLYGGLQSAEVVHGSFGTPSCKALPLAHSAELLGFPRLPHSLGGYCCVTRACQDPRKMRNMILQYCQNQTYFH